MRGGLCERVSRAREVLREGHLGCVEFGSFSPDDAFPFDFSGSLSFDDEIR